MRLIMLPFAGGYSQTYRPLLKAAPAGLECLCPELPGRGQRFGEKAFNNLGDMVEDLGRQVGQYLDQPYALYGHSMGSLLAWLLAHRLRALGAPLPRALLVSGLEGPAMLTRPVKRHLLPREEFRQFLKALGGSQEGVLEDAELFDLFEPVLRADFQALEEFEYPELKPLGLPITMLRGEQDTVSPQESQAWQRETTGPFQVIDFQGGHFFIFDHADRVMSIAAETSSQA